MLCYIISLYWALLSLQVRFGVRDPKSEKVAAALEAVGYGVTAEPVQSAVKFGQVVIFAVPFKDLEAAVQGAGDLTGKIVIDATNPVVFQNGKLSLSIGTTTSAGMLEGFQDKECCIKTQANFICIDDLCTGEKFAEWTKGAKAVKAFNTMGFNIMENPKFDSTAADLRILYSFILFYFILFYFILFYFILFYFILFLMAVRYCW
jgi:hypothetical protein